MRPAFVVTVAALAHVGCRTSNPPPAEEHQKSATASTRPAVAAKRDAARHPEAHQHENPPAPQVPTDASKRRRPVRADIPARKPSPEQSGGRAQNPTTAEGRTIYARKDGHCYVRLPPAVDAAPPEDSHQAHTVVIIACPPAMDDPAWDTCLDGHMRKLSDERCICMREGNPPPPTTRAECPGSSRK